MNAPAEAVVSLDLKDRKLLRQQCYIDGKWVDADSRNTIAVHNPATGEELGSVPRMGAAEAKRAIEAAERAWPAWRAKTAKERAAILRKWYDLMMANQEDLAQIMTAEQGKPLTESRGESPTALRSSNGSLKKRSAPMAIRFLRRGRTSASW